VRREFAKSDLLLQAKKSQETDGTSGDRKLAGRSRINHLQSIVAISRQRLTSSLRQTRMIFHGAGYGLRIFCRKTAQLCTRPEEPE
jgi:hypothetical protein